MSIQERQQQETEEKTDDQPTLYESAHDLSLDSYITNHQLRFIDAVLDETGDADEWADARVVEIYGWQSTEDLELLLAYEDDVRQFVGQDETSKQGSELFSFFIRPEAGDPPVRTVEEALEMLKPHGVREALVTSDVGPKRQGEWWLLADQGEPESDVFKPGVSERPFGGSPLANHVPREYAFGVTADELFQRIQDEFPEFPAGDSLEDVFQKMRIADRMRDSDDITLETPVPEYHDIRSLAEGVYVRGTLRHRDSEHYLEKIGEEWHLALTHDVEVYTVDDYTLRESSSDSRWVTID